MKNNICGCLKKYCPHFTEAEEDNTICMAKEINKAKLLNNMKPIECINCGLLRSTCEMENGNEWTKNCQKIEGKKHEFTATTLEEDWEIEFREKYKSVWSSKYLKFIRIPEATKGNMIKDIKQILVNSNKKTLQAFAERVKERIYYDINGGDIDNLLKEFLKDNK